MSPIIPSAAYAGVELCQRPESKMATWYMNINFPNIMLVGLLLNSMASERQKTNVSG